MLSPPEEALRIPAADVRAGLLTLSHAIRGGSAASWARHNTAARWHTAAGGSRRGCSMVSTPKSQRKGRIMWKSQRKIALLKTWRSHSSVIFAGR